MIGPSIQSSELDSFRMANSLIKSPSSKSGLEGSFEEVLENQAQEAANKVKDKATDVVIQDKYGTKKKKAKDGLDKDDVLKFTPFTQNIGERRASHELQNTYSLLEKFKERKKTQEEELFKSPREQAFNNAYNVAGQPLIQPVYDQAQRRMSKSQMLAAWEKFAPLVTEDITKKAVRLDIPLLNDVQAVILRMHPDRSVTASLLGSQQMGELIKQNKDKLDRNLRHHHLSLREFNTYRSELEFTNESGTRKKKRQAKSVKKTELDLI